MLPSDFRLPILISPKNQPPDNNYIKAFLFCSDSIFLALHLSLSLFTFGQHLHIIGSETLLNREPHILPTLTKYHPQTREMLSKLLAEAGRLKPKSSSTEKDTGKADSKAEDGASGSGKRVMFGEEPGKAPREIGADEEKPPKPTPGDGGIPDVPRSKPSE